MGTEASEGRAAQGSGRRKEIPTLPAGFEGDSSPSRFLPGARLARGAKSSHALDPTTTTRPALLSGSLRARTKAQRGTTYSPRLEAPSPPQRPERGRREWAAGKAGEAGHHAPRGLSHSNSPWGDAAGGQRAGDAAAKGVCGGGFGGARLSYGRGPGPRRRVRGRAMEKDMAEMGAERRDRLGEIDAQTCTEAEAVRGGQRGPGRGPQRCRARGPPCPTPSPPPVPTWWRPRATFRATASAAGPLLLPESLSLDLRFPHGSASRRLWAPGRRDRGGGWNGGAPPTWLPQAKALGHARESQVHTCAAPASAYVYPFEVRASAPVLERVFACAPVCVWAGGVTPCVVSVHRNLPLPSPGAFPGSSALSHPRNSRPETCTGHFLGPGVLRGNPG